MSAPGKRQGLVAIDAVMALMAVLLVVQMWLLTATLDAFLGGDARAVLPAAIASGAILAACVALTMFVNRIDRSARSEGGPGT